MIWPTWMDQAGLMAKSSDKGGETLAEHTWQVLSRLSDQVRLRPYLPQLLADDRLWSRMYWACFLHDFGKAAREFQAVLQKKKTDWGEYKQRHEILSLAFVDWLFPQDHIDRDWVIAVIAFHHKDWEIVKAKYGGDKPAKEIDADRREMIEEVLTHLANQINEETSNHLWRWIHECGLAWATELNIPLIDPPPLLSWEQARTQKFKASIFKALRSFAQWNERASESQKYAAMLARGLILTADHSASGGAKRFPDMPLNWEIAQKPLQGHTLRDHQHAAGDAPVGSAIMIAPTGSGKTEAAILWAARQMVHRPAARLFYTLPYQASMNAMYARLAIRYFEIAPEQLSDLNANRVLTIQHSRALLKLYQDAMGLDEMGIKERLQMAKRLNNLAELNFFPIQIFSPYQMLKAAYSLKSYETLLLDYTDALFIFDEIHAYEPARLALIITMIGWLRQHFGARFLVMTATLPPLVKEKLIPALGVGVNSIIEASNDEFTRSQRHIVKILDGRLCDEIVVRIRDDFLASKSVLVCLNRIADAQAVYQSLKAELNLTPDEEIVLLHGRFNGKDRRRKEEILLAKAGVGKRKQLDARHGFVTVATQVVEVSLDVDFDTIYTDPAPLEALLQRFGRVNRGRAERLFCPVHIFRFPSNHKKDPYKPYSEEMVNRSLAVLETYCGQGEPIDESKVTSMLGEIYQEAVEREWRSAFDQATKDFQEAILSTMRPFESATKEIWERFYEMFDGREVLPITYWDEYYTALDQGGYLEASKYLVNISSKQYAQFKEFIFPTDDKKGGYADHIQVDYSTELGLELDSAWKKHQARKQNTINDEMENES